MINELRKVVKSPETMPEEKEAAVMEILRMLMAQDNFEEIGNTIIGLKGLWEGITTSRITKITKQVFEMLPCSPSSFDSVLQLIEGLIAWADAENKKMLRLDLECKKIYALLRTGRYAETLSQTGPVIQELKKYDDKINLITLYVYESKAYYEVKDVSRSKSCLTSARVLAVSAYCPPQLQAQIDLLSGIYICDERNYGVASSYFIEALEGFTLDKAHAEACLTLRYLILSKIIGKRWDEIGVVMKNKNALRHLNDEMVRILFKISDACSSRDLKAYSNILLQHSEQIRADSFICAHLQYLYDILLDSNIIKISEPYSIVRIAFIAGVLDFEVDVVEKKLRKMILDGTIDGILDHVNQCLVLHEKKTANNFVNECIQQIDALGNIVSQH